MQIYVLPDGRAHPFAEYPDKPAHHHCVQCRAPMVVHLKTDSGYLARNVSLGTMDRDGHFDTLRCAARFGVRAIKSGFALPIHGK